MIDTVKGWLRIVGPLPIVLLLLALFVGRLRWLLLGAAAVAAVLAIFLAKRSGTATVGIGDDGEVSQDGIFSPIS